MMKLIPGICSQCGATLSVEKSKEAMICPYCDTPFVVEKAIEVFNATYNITNNINAQNVIIEGKSNYDFNIVGGVLIKYTGSSISVIIPDEVINIGESAFADTMISEVMMSNNVREIDSSAFINCKCLEKIDLSENLLSIGARAFKGCAQLKEIILPNTLKKIGWQVFDGCEQLETVYLSSKLLELYQYVGYAFAHDTDNDYADDKYGIGCEKLQNIYIDGILLEDDELYFRYFPYTIKGQEAALYKQQKEWKMKRVCQHCGGTFDGFFTLYCRKCGKQKDY